MKVRVIVVTHKALPALRQCLDSIGRFTPASCLDVRVMDNASGAAVRAFLGAQRRLGRLAAHSFPRNVGKAAAINFAVDTDDDPPDWYVLLDDDAQVGPSWLEKLLETARRHPSASIIGPRIVHPDGRIQSAEMHSWLYALGNGESDLGQRSYTRYCDCLVGVCLMIRRDVLREVRFWDRLGQPCEDSDFCLSARKKGRRVLYFGEVAIRHESLRRHGRRAAANATLMRIKWPLRAFPDSHPRDKLYVEISTRGEAGDWAQVVRLCRRLRRLEPVPAYPLGWEWFALTRLGALDEARAALENALAQRQYKFSYTARLLGCRAPAAGQSRPLPQWRELFKWPAA